MLLATVQARHPTVPLYRAVVQLVHAPATTPYPVSHVVHAVLVHSKQFRPQAAQVDPDSRYLLRHEEQAVLEVQAEQPAGQATQSPKLALGAL